MIKSVLNSLLFITTESLHSLVVFRLAIKLLLYNTGNHWYNSNNIRRVLFYYHWKKIPYFGQILFIWLSFPSYVELFNVRIQKYRCPGVSWSVLGYLGVSWGNQTDPPNPTTHHGQIWIHTEKRREGHWLSLVHKTFTGTKQCFSSF